MAINIDKSGIEKQYFYEENGNTFGPFSLSILLNKINANTLVYREGIDWTEAKEIAELKNYFKVEKVIEKKEPSKETNRTKPIVEGKKSNNAGLWFLIILLISAGVGFYFYNQNKAISSEMNNNKQDVINENPISDNVNNEVSAQEVLQQTQTAPNTSVNNSSTISGNFPQASKRLLTSSDLSALGKQDLKIMRNEIFARHGYIFKTQEMKSYFENQSWYSGQYNDVISMLSAIEMQNIELIKRYE